MSLQFEGIWGGVGAVDTLIGPFPSVTSYVPLQLAQLHAGVVAFSAFVWLLVRVDVASVTDQLSRSREGALAKFAFVRLK